MLNKPEDLEVSIRYKGQDLTRYFMVEDGNAPEAAKDIQGMINVIENTAKVPF